LGEVHDGHGTVLMWRLVFLEGRPGPDRRVGVRVGVTVSV
jgi:hypothetical protein